MDTFFLSGSICFVHSVVDPSSLSLGASRPFSQCPSHVGTALLRSRRQFHQQPAVHPVAKVGKVCTKLKRSKETNSDGNSKIPQSLSSCSCCCQSFPPSRCQRPSDSSVYDGNSGERTQTRSRDKRSDCHTAGTPATPVTFCRISGWREETEEKEAISLIISRFREMCVCACLRVKTFTFC